MRVQKSVSNFINKHQVQITLGLVILALAYNYSAAKPVNITIDDSSVNVIPDPSPPPIANGSSIFIINSDTNIVQQTDADNVKIEINPGIRIVTTDHSRIEIRDNAPARGPCEGIDHGDLETDICKNMNDDVAQGKPAPLASTVCQNYLRLSCAQYDYMRLGKDIFLIYQLAMSCYALLSSTGTPSQQVLCNIFAGPSGEPALATQIAKGCAGVLPLDSGDYCTPAHFFS